MVYREDLHLSVRALLRRPVETLLITAGVALTVGATVTAITLTSAREFLVRSLIIMVAASMLGVVFSLFLSAPLTDLVTPIFSADFAADDLFEPVVAPAAVAVGVAAAIGAGGLLGTLPVFHVLATPIAEAIRD